jgi:P-type Ca2+ transporter type 2C
VTVRTISIPSASELIEVRPQTCASSEHLEVQALLYSSALCSNATEITGQPTERAILRALRDAALADPRQHYERTHEIPFSSDRKRMDVHARPIAEHCCKTFTTLRVSSFSKGMPEAILNDCSKFLFSETSTRPMTETDRNCHLETARRMASHGMRVLAVACDDIFCGLLGLEDPPREGVTESVWQLRQGGVNCYMITGDAKETALAIAKKCGILDVALNEKIDEENIEDALMNGKEIDDAGSELSNLIAGVKVFYRVAPRHKLAIVRACKCRWNFNVAPSPWSTVFSASKWGSRLHDR